MNHPGSSSAAGHSAEPDPRVVDALIALNADLSLPRNRVCLLGQHLQTESEVGARDLGAIVDGSFDGPWRAAARSTLSHASRLACAERRSTASLGGEIVTCLEPGYPSSLRALELPPAVLAVRGRLPLATSLAIVGPRHPDPWAADFAATVASAAARAGHPVVSGFAQGVDIAAHRGAAEHGATLAVLGCGLGVPYPRAHHAFAERIVARGAVISELPFGAQPKAQNFPVRNRIIAALARCTLVVQASKRSGSLITARFAAELGRDVLAVPGRLTDARSAGSNLLLRDGAHLVLEPADALVLLGLSSATIERSSDHRLAPPPSQPTGSSLQRRVLEALGQGESHADALLECLECGPGELQAVLMQLELDGLVERSGARLALKERDRGC